MPSDSHQKKAFSLAEVLITLGIIGVVASLVIPTLIQRSDERANVASLKKAYSTLSSAFTLAVQENGTPDTWGLVAGHSTVMINTIKPYLRVTKDCTDGSKGCFPGEVNYMHLSSSRGIMALVDDQVRPKVKLADGTLMMSYVESATCSSEMGDTPALKNICGTYTIDINGYKKPNILGQDFFSFWLTKYGIIPIGSAQETDSTAFTVDCKDRNNSNGYGCAAWVIYNDNMDYLHCTDLTWGGKTKCN